jgi:small conductance mechanosensitive channel
MVATLCFPDGAVNLLKKDITMDITTLESIIISFSINLFWAILILVIGWWLAGRIAGLVTKRMTAADVEPSLVGFAGSISYWAIILFTILSALARMGVQTTSIIAVLGAGSLAIGLALQGSLSNFAAGVLILLFRPYKIGDVVELAGALGTVEEIQIFNTILVTFDNKTIIVPNAQATGGNIINYTTRGTRRVDMVFGIGYTDDLVKAKQILHEIIAADDRVLSDPAPVIAVLELADSSVNLAVRPFVNVADYWGVLVDTTEKVKLRFDQEGISIPYPQQDVHILAANGD